MALLTDYITAYITQKNHTGPPAWFSKNTQTLEPLQQTFFKG